MRVDVLKKRVGGLKRELVESNREFAYLKIELTDIKRWLMNLKR